MGFRGKAGVDVLVDGTVVLDGATALDLKSGIGVNLVGAVAGGSPQVTHDTNNSATLPPGFLLPWPGSKRNVPAGFIYCNGAAESRTTFAALLAALTIAQTGTLTNGQVAVTGLTSTDELFVGCHVEGAGIPAGATVASITSATAITLSAAATAGGATPLTFFPWGNGDGLTTFNVPNGIGRGFAGVDTAGAVLASNKPGLGQTLGEELHTLSLPEMPSHSHPLPSTTTANSFQIASGNGDPILSGSGLNTSAIGGGGAHNNLAPSLFGHWIVKD